MVRRWWRRFGPWLVPALIVIEVALVLSGRLDFGTAIIVVVALELLLGLAAIGRIVTAIRSARAARSAGVDGWTAAQDGLARVVPRPLARVILTEPRLLVELFRWLTGRHDAHAVGAFGYQQSMRLLIWAMFGLVVLEGAIVELVLALLLPHSVWPWIALGVHIYGLIWLAGFYASLVTLPHRLGERELRVRDGVFGEVVIAYSAITRARCQRQSNMGRSGFKITGRAALLAYGDATVTIDLAPRPRILVNGELLETEPSTLSITVDKPQEFVRALEHARSAYSSA